MSLRHLFAGIMVGVFALALGVDSSAVGPEAISSVAVAADKTPSKSADEKAPDRIAKDQDRSKPADKAEKVVARDTTWARRLIFPSGNKF